MKALEEKGIGRPSTYASIMQTIQAREYVFKKGQALVPTPDAFAVTKLLEGHFTQLVDYEFTAHMEEQLDEIAGGRGAREPYLAHFWFGNGSPGVKVLCADALVDADPAEINTIPLGVDADGQPVAVRNGKFGPYVKRGEDTASIPPATPLDELTLDQALDLLAAPKGDDPIGTDPDSGLPVYAKNGRFGPYVQLGDAETLPPKAKPKMASLFADMSLATLSIDDALRLLSLPRAVGVDPADGVEITAQGGRYGPYIKKGEETRSLDSEAAIFTVTVEGALALLAQPKQFGRRRAAAAAPLRELGNDPVSDKPVVVREGRFGPYVTDGETNASLRKDDTVEDVTIERAAELLQDRRDRGPTPPQAAAKKATAKACAEGTRQEGRFEEGHGEEGDGQAGVGEEVLGVGGSLLGRARRFERVGGSGQHTAGLIGPSGASAGRVGAARRSRLSRDARTWLLRWISAARPTRGGRVRRLPIRGSTGPTRTPRSWVRPCTSTWCARRRAPARPPHGCCGSSGRPTSSVSGWRRCSRRSATGSASSPSSPWPPASAAPPRARPRSES